MGGVDCSESGAIQSIIGRSISGVQQPLDIYGIAAGDVVDASVPVFQHSSGIVIGKPTSNRPWPLFSENST